MIPPIEYERTNERHKASLESPRLTCGWKERRMRTEIKGGVRMSYESAYKRALQSDFIEQLREMVRDWREQECNGSREYMYNIETWVHEIWGPLE